MIETEGEIEGGVAEPGAFGVEEHRPLGALQDVLGADVAVNQRPLRRERRMRELVETRGKLRMGAAGRAQVRLDADRLERGVVGEGGGNIRIGGAARMDEAKIAPDRRSEIRSTIPARSSAFHKRWSSGAR